jgi:hypothetical protein
VQPSLRPVFFSFFSAFRFISATAQSLILVNELRNFFAQKFSYLNVVQNQYKLAARIRRAVSHAQLPAIKKQGDKMTQPSAPPSIPRFPHAGFGVSMLPFPASN